MRAAALLLVLAACAPAPSPAVTPPASPAVPAGGAGAQSDTALVGTVRVVGSAPMNVQVVLREASGRTSQVTGALLREVQRLAGAEVALWGRMEGGALNVARYEVRRVDGQPVVMGRVEKVADGVVQLRTPAGALIQLSGAVQALQVGQTVWVQGPSTVRVQSYGVIRP